MTHQWPSVHWLCTGLRTMNLFEGLNSSDESNHQLGRVKRIWYLSPMRAASSEFGTYRPCEQRRFRRASASAQSRQNLRCSLIRAMSQRETFRQKARSLAPLNDWAYAVKICHYGMLEDTNSLDGAQLMFIIKKTVLTTVPRLKCCT